MAKTEKDPGEAPVPKAPLSDTITFIDQTYDRRKLFLPNWAELEVVRGVVEIRRDNQLAVDYMRNRPDFTEQRT